MLRATLLLHDVLSVWLLSWSHINLHLALLTSCSTELKCWIAWPYFRASGSVRRHCPLPLLLLVSSPACSVVLCLPVSFLSTPLQKKGTLILTSLQKDLVSLSLSLCLSPALFLSLSLPLHCSVTSLLSCFDTAPSLPFMTLNCHLTTGIPLHFPSCPFHVSHDVLVMSLPFLSLSLSFSRYVRFIFHACVSLSFPLHSPCFHLCPIHVPCHCFPFISRCFPVMPTSYFLPSFPCTSLHFPPQHFPQNKHGFSSVFAKRTSKTQSFSRFSAKGERAGRGIQAWDPCLATPAPRG